jgi:uncharacterized cupin superfamily protein
MGINIEKPNFDEPREQEGFRALRARISRQAGAERLGASLWEVPPGQAAYPYHAHLAEEELVVVLSGTPSLRTPGGWRELEQGRGGLVRARRGGRSPEVLQPDSRKIGAFERRPDGGGLRVWFRREDEAQYYDGESAPS